MNAARRIFAGLVLAQAGVGHASAESAVLSAPLEELPNVVLSLLVVVGCIVLGAWLLRRSPMLKGARTKGRLKVLSTLALGPRERIVLVETGRSHLLIGVSPAGMFPLERRRNPVDAEVEAEAPEHAGRGGGSPELARLLQELRG
jgi:flagellar protein FliO/FliZ